jgi:hypothetical protein
MEKVEVTARFNTQGKVIPISFVWSSRAYRPESIGRSWHADDGFHILVMDHTNRAYHLLFAFEEMSWYLLRGGNIPTVPMA